MSHSTDLTYAGLILLFMFFLAYSLKALKFPYIVSFMLSGFALRPLVPESISDFLLVFEHSAVSLLFFFVGLEYSFERLAGMIRIVKAGFIDLFINFVPVFVISYLFTGDLILSLVISCAIYPSSTAITAKLFMDYKRLIYPEVDLLIGILIFEDLVSIILLSLLAGFLYSGNLSVYSVGKSMLFLFSIFLFFYFLKDITNRLLEFLARKIDESMLIFLTLGTLMMFSGIAIQFHMSEALLAFILGVLVPEDSKIFKNIQSSLSSLKELSVGLFFFFFTYKAHLSYLVNTSFIVILIFTSLLFKLISTYISSLLYGFDRKVSLRASLSFLQRGEFSLIFASLYQPAQAVTFLLILITSLIGSFSFVLAPKLADLVFPRRRSSKAPPQVP
ncbi:MAG: cation:proton antiporter [Hydrogenobacter sp.]